MREKIEEDLVERFKNGDEEAFTTIYNQSYKKVYYFVYKHCYNSEIAKDVVQNAYISAYRNKSALRDNSSFYAWVLRISYRELQKVRKKEERNTWNTERLNLNLDVNTLFEIQKDERFVLEVVEKDAVKLVFEVIGNMPDNFQDVALLRYGHDLTIKEISSILSIPVGTVKSRIYRINKIIKKELTQKDMTIDIYKSVSFMPLVLELLSDNSSMNSGAISNIITQANMQMGKSKGFIEHLYKVLLYFLGISTACGGVAYLVFINQDSKVNKNGIAPVLPLVVEVIPEACQIVSIDYNTEYVSSSLGLNIKTNNNNYDSILVNGIDTRTISENGTYKVSLMYNQTVIDEREIVISNIDNEEPQLLSIDNEGNNYYIRLDDAFSGINDQSIVYYQNGTVSNNYTYDSKTKTISFIFVSKSTNVFYVEDKAGNWREVFVNSDLV
ncbi:MAG: RNA polymerase sigma factor [Coprobacillaceae bacterium]